MSILELLNKPIIELTEEEWKKVQQSKNKKKPSVPFSSATLNDCARLDGLALDLSFIEPFALPAPSLYIPQEIVTPVPSDFLCEHLLTVQQHFVLNNQKSCRMLIDAILIEVLKSEFNDSLYGFCQVKNDWQGTGFGYTGDVDYMLGSSKTKSVDTMDSFILVVEAKFEWSDSAVPQVLAAAGCLLKKRLQAGKKTPVFAVLTNGIDFRFFAIDIDGVVYSSYKEVLQPAEDGTYNSSSSLSEILRWFTWFMTAVKNEDSLAQLRNCFGPKYPISRKKLKTRK